MSEPYPDLECKRRPRAEPLPAPRRGDWLAEHDEPGQTFGEYPYTELFSHLGDKQ
jgi:hypothetical protein